MYRAALTFLLLISSTAVFGGIVNGVDVPGAPVVAPVSGVAATVAPPAGATVIDFDDVQQAPCLFIDSPGPLGSRYSDRGVVFSGPAPGSGGFIVDQCGGFSVSGQSAPNFLAFNTEATLPNGGSAQGPERIEFAQPVSLVQINVGHATSGTITLACFAGSAPAGTSSILGGSLLNTIVVSGSAITSCLLSFSGNVLVADDLAFVVGSAAPTAIPALDELGFLALFVMLALFGALRLLRGSSAG